MPQLHSEYLYDSGIEGINLTKHVQDQWEERFVYSGFDLLQCLNDAVPVSRRRVFKSALITKGKKIASKTGPNATFLYHGPSRAVFVVRQDATYAFAVITVFKQKLVA